MSILNALGDDGRVSGLAFIASSMFLLPIFRKFVYLITRRAISGRVRGMCITLLLLTAVIFLEGPDAYKSVAEMTKVTSHYHEAIRLARSTYLKGYTQYLNGQTQEALVPEDAAGWILVFNPP